MMKKTAYILVALLTFSASVAIYFVFLNFAVDKTKPLVKPIDASSLPLVSLCEAMRNPKLHKIGVIRIKAKFTAAKDGEVNIFELKKGCSRNFVDIGFWNGKNEILSREEINYETQKLINELKEQTSGKLTAIVEAELIGELEFQEFDRCFDNGHFYFRAKEFKPTSPVKLIDLRKELEKIKPQY